MGKVDPNEAPEGYMALECAEFDSCDPCAFFPPMSKKCREAYCDSISRADGCFVHFIKRSDKPATASWPYDSEGTPV